MAAGEPALSSVTPATAVPVKAVLVKQDRDEIFVEYTKSICPVCKVVVDAQVNVRHAKFWAWSTPGQSPPAPPLMSGIRDDRLRRMTGRLGGVPIPGLGTVGVCRTTCR